MEFSGNIGVNFAPPPQKKKGLIETEKDFRAQEEERQRDRNREREIGERDRARQIDRYIRQIDREGKRERKRKKELELTKKGRLKL